MSEKNKVKVLAVFGSYNFNTNIVGQSRGNRSKRLSSIFHILKEINPKKVLYVPTQGINAVIGGILNELKIKRTMVVPYPGFAESLPRIQRLLIKEAWNEKYSSAFFLEDHEEEVSFSKRSQLLNQATEHLVSQADAALVLHGETQTEHLKGIVAMLERQDKPTYIFNYDDFS